MPTSNSSATNGRPFDTVDAGDLADVATKIGVRELRAGLAKHIARAEAGDRLIVTVDGRAVAQLGPIAATTRPALEELIAAGLIEAPRRRDRPRAKPADTLATGLTPERVLRELRGR